MSNFEKFIYLSGIIFFACSIAWIFSGKVVCKEDICKKETRKIRDCMCACEKNHVMGNVSHYEILGYDIININLDDSSFAIITYGVK